MAFRKKTEHKRVAITRQRLAGVQKIDANRGKILNYGLEDKPLTQKEIQESLDAYTAAVTSYNQLLMQADVQNHTLKQMEATLTKTGIAILKGVVSKFGYDANEVEMVGGKRLSDRKTPVRKKAA